MIKIINPGTGKSEIMDKPAMNELRQLRDMAVENNRESFAFRGMEITVAEANKVLLADF